jgi:hypothetical protein
MAHASSRIAPINVYQPEASGLQSAVQSTVQTTAQSLIIGIDSTISPLRVGSNCLATVIRRARRRQRRGLNLQETSSSS